MSNFLPTGSVVLLKGATKKIMICGRLQTEVKSGEVFDYSACFYPEGIINPRELYLFNHDQIEKIFYMGYQDDEELQFEEFIQGKKDEYLASKEEQ